jgi:3-oxoacyl-[acyl-carrier-protein] synthase-1
MRVFVVGLGVISALGENVEQNLHSLLAMRHGLNSRSTMLDDDLPDLPVGAVRLSNHELLNKWQVRTKIPRSSLLGLNAAFEALQAFHPGGERLGFVSGTTVGGMNNSETYFKHYVPVDKKQQKRDIIYHTCSSSTEKIAEQLRKLHYVSTINTACSSAANTVMLCARKIKQGQLDTAIAGGTDSLCNYTIRGFGSLLILDSELCRPFDNSRQGLNLGEGAGYVLLVSEELMTKYSLAPIAELVGYANANDAYHATASSETGEGAYRSMTEALKMAGISPTEIDYINLHGTGTQNNDESEGIALQRVFGEHLPAFSSTKSYTGHTLGASGGIEAVFSCLAIRENVIFPNLRFHQPMDDLNLVPVTEVIHQPINYVLSNSFGFGGNCSSLIFKKC